ncbi:major facilitator superfamily domain-containing protein [Panaeolus papilionaceus]|nr:major facilitator superfamily domain-containing protein [Panaeolus papilionaceus]
MIVVENQAEVESRHIEDRQEKLPWWRRPSPWWLLVTAPLLTIAYSATIAPRVEIYTIAACREQKLATIDLISGPFNAAFADTADERLPDCASDPAVQAAAAKLATAITTTMGVLTCLTTGFWGSFSDRHGRTRVMGLSLTGALVADIVFISVVRFYKILPGGSWFLLVASVVEGLLGGMAAGEASLQSYMADVTDESSRSRFFSLTVGLLLVGIALGPTIGSVIIAATHNTLSVFYFTAALHVLLALWAFLILPESVSKERRQESKAKYFQELHTSSLEGADQRNMGGISFNVHRIFPFLRPLTVFLPYREDSRNPLKKKKRDWSLTLMALGYGSTVAIMGCHPFKLLYAAATFHWSSVEQGYFIGLVGLTSGIFLTLIFPIITKSFKPRPVIVETLDTSTDPPTTIKKEVYSFTFDLNIVKASLVLSIIVYCSIGTFTSALVFTLMGMVGSFGLGISPVMCALR